MQPKKNLNANIEKQRLIHLQVGFIIALSMVLVALEWGNPKQSTDEMNYAGIMFSAEKDLIPLIPRTEQKKEKIPDLLIPIPVDDQDIPDIDIASIFDQDRTGYVPDWIFPNGDEDIETIETPFDATQVQFMAEFPGGEEAMIRWIYNNLKYPEICVEHGIEGRVIAKFTVNKFGVVEDVEIIRKVHPELDAEVLRVLKKMPKFRPAMQNERLVPVYMHWPVLFKLR
ncbi:MAG: energy transducer TonB [Bacteroidales bacterium]